MAQALVAGGLRVLEMTSRTPAALDAIAEMKRAPGEIVGAVMVVDAGRFARAMEAVLCVGGSWLAAGTMAEVEGEARATVDLR